MQKPKSTKAAKRELNKLERMRSAVQMRKDGMPVRAIALKLGCSHPTVLNDLNEGLEELKKETITEIEKYRTIQIARREEIINAHKDIATDPSNEAWKASADIIDKNETALSKLMGTDQPIKIESKAEVTGDAGPAVVFEVHHPSVEPSFTPPEPEDDGDDNIST